MSTINEALKELNRVKRLKEDFASSMPVTALPTSEVKNYIMNIPAPGAGRPPVMFKLGYFKEIPLAAKYSGKRGSVNKETGEVMPRVRVIKCTEYSQLYTGVDWAKTDATKKADKVLGTERHTGEKTGFSYGDEATANRIGVYPNGSEALQAYIATTSKQRVKYYISINDEDLHQTTKDEVAKYMSPADANKLLNPTVRTAAGVDANGNEIFDKPINRFKLSNIYMIGNLGHSVMTNNESLDEAASNDHFYECDFHWDGIDGPTFTVKQSDGGEARVFLTDGDDGKVYIESEYGHGVELRSVKDLRRVLEDVFNTRSLSWDPDEEKELVNNIQKEIMDIITKDTDEDKVYDPHFAYEIACHAWELVSKDLKNQIPADEDLDLYFKRNIWTREFKDELIKLFSNLDSKSHTVESLEESLHGYSQKAWELNEIISAMNNEEAYYGGWLYIWPDEESKEDCEYDFGDKDSYQELEDTFVRVYKEYHKDGLYTKDPKIVEAAHAWDKKLGLPEIEAL